MKNILGLLIGLMALNAYAVNQTDREELLKEVNILPNPDFERNRSGWSASGGAIAHQNSGSNLLFGSGSLAWNASAAAQILNTRLYSIPNGFVGQSCQAEITYKWATGVAGDLQFKVIDGAASDLAVLNLEPTVGSNTRVAQLFFTCPATPQTLRIQLLAVGADPAEIALDKAFLGSGRSNMQMAGARVDATAYRATSAQSVTVNTATVVQFNAEELDVFGEFNVGTGVFTAKSARTLLVSSQLYLSNYTTSELASIFIRKNGAVVCSAQNTINSTSSFVNIANCKVDVVQGDFIETTVDSVADTAYEVVNDQTFSRTTFLSLPSAQSESLNLATTGWRVDANIGGSNPSLGTGTVTSYVEIADAGLDLVNASGGNVIPAKIPCSGTNPVTGLTCAAGNESIGINFDVPTAGDVLVCFSGNHSVTVNPSGGVAATFQLVETASNAQTILQEGKSRMVSREVFDGVEQSINGLNVCGTFYFASAGNKTIRLMFELADITGTVLFNIMVGDRDASRGQRDFHFEAYPITNQMPAPVFTEIQSKPDAGTTNIKLGMASLNCSGSSSQLLDPQNMVSAVGNISAGSCSVTFESGYFGSAPSCLVGELSSGLNLRSVKAHTVTSSGLTFKCRESSTTGSATSIVDCTALDFVLSCQGPK